MSVFTVTVPPRQTRSIPAGFVEAKCFHCDAAIAVREDMHYSPCCMSCRRGFADFEARKLVSSVNELINGTGEFNVLSQADRQEQLNLLGIGIQAKIADDDAPSFVIDREEPDAVTRDEIEDLCAQMDASAAQDAAECPDPYEEW